MEISPSERRGVAAAFATACLALSAWAFPNMTRLITIPGAIACFLATVYFLWPEIQIVWAAIYRQRIWATVVVGLLLVSAMASFVVLQRDAIPATIESHNTPSAQPLHYLQSTADKTIYACEVPAPDPKIAGQFTEKMQQYQKDLSVIGDTFGVKYTITNINGGVRLDMQTTSPVVKNKIFMATGLRDVDTLTYEIRRVEQQVLVSVYANFPEPVRQFYSLLTPDPNSPESIQIRRQIEHDILGVPDGSCHMV